VSNAEEVRVNPERQSRYALAFCLLLAGAIPQLAWTADEGFSADFVQGTPSSAAFGPEMSKAAVFFPAVAGLLALFLAGSMPRWLRGLGFVGLGAGLLFYVADRAGVPTAFNGQFATFARIDMLLLAGMALAFVAARAQADSTPSFVLSLLVAVSGLAVLTWLVLPRGVTAADTWFGLTSKDQANTIPIVRGFLRNGEFSAGTHPARYVWWNLFLGALVLFPLLCLRVPTRRRELRDGAADKAYGMLVFVLLSLALSPVVVAALGEQFKLNTPEGEPVVWQPALVAAANAARLVFPPLLLAGLALVGASDFLKSVSAVRVSRPSLRMRFPRLRLPRLPKISVLPAVPKRGAAVPPPQIPPEPVGTRRPRVRMVTDAYGNPQRV
jgi:hypothetical protein